MRKLFAFALAALMLLMAGALAEENLLTNGDFSALEGGLPAGWSVEQWFMEDGVSALSVDPDGYDGNSAHIQNFSLNDARFAQTVAVEPDTLYRISCVCRASGIGDAGAGATISIKDTFSYSNAARDTGGEWETLELYGRTGEDQTELTVYIRVGGYSAESAGEAWFDDVEITAVDAAPDGVAVASFAPVSNDAEEAEAESSDAEAATEAPERNTEMYVLLACVYLLVVLAAARKCRRAPEREPECYANCLIAMLICAFALRAVIAVNVLGYAGDINCFLAWGNHMLDAGPVDFYATVSWCDYPPGYLWMLAPVSALIRLFGLSSAVEPGLHLLFIKLWPILADLAAACVVYWRAKKRFGARAALWLSAFFAFNPAVLVDSAAWGQMDSVYTLLIALCAIEASDEKYISPLVLFAISLLVKPQTMLFAPLGLLAVLVNLIRSAENPKRALAWTAVSLAAGGGFGAALYIRAAVSDAFAFGAAVLVLGALCLALIVYGLMRGSRPVRRTILGLTAALGILYAAALISAFDASREIAYLLWNPVRWLINLYTNTVGGYPHLTVNALNLYYLLGGNWTELAAQPATAAFAYGMMALSFVYCMALYVIARDRKKLTLLGGVMIALICAFGPMVHERYSFPAVLLLLLGYVECRDKRVLIGATVLSATLFLNEILVLQGGLVLGNYGHLQPSEDWINIPVALLNVLNALFLAWTALDVCVLWPKRIVDEEDDAPDGAAAAENDSTDDGMEEVELVEHVYPLSESPVEKKSPGERTLFAKGDHKLHLKRIDAILMAVVTLVYAVVAFVNLGTTSAPQTTWISGSADESIVFDLSSVERFRMTYYGNICSAYTTNFIVELSNDGEVWTAPQYAKYGQSEVFRWLWYVPSDASGATVYNATTPSDDGSAFVAFSGYEGETYPFQTARYIRITAGQAGLELMEVGFIDEDGAAYEIQSIEQTGSAIVSDAQLLIDEQDTIPAYPSYYNSTYFDEIYHARTAYEHLHGEPTYEYTHPPLGKVLMMVGIELFGMTPFGWRFMGAVMGVLMVPLMYLLVKQLTKSTKLSFVAMFLLTVDSMHFTQTRIATIDSYAVFWIMLMYFFMFRYFQMRWTSAQAFRRSLIPLGLCGVTMGIAWATKWIGIYASAGLAVLFFWSLYRRWREYRYARAHMDKGENAELCAAVAEVFRGGAVATLAFCVVFFIVIPVLIYYFSYFWYLRGISEASWAAKGVAGFRVTSFADLFSGDCVREIIDLQKRIFDYHAGLGGDTHAFRSEWYEWPIIWWPMWYYSGSAYLPADGMVSSISCMGNPAVWWFGLVAMLFVLGRTAWMRRAPKTYVMVIIAFASQFLPWVLVPRSTFIYHYFASVPFIIIASVLMLNWIRSKSDAAFKAVAITLMVAALVLFIAFYPLESGLPVARSYAQYLRWFEWINF